MLKVLWLLLPTLLFQPIGGVAQDIQVELTTQNKALYCLSVGTPTQSKQNLLDVESSGATLELETETLLPVSDLVLYKIALEKAKQHFYISTCLNSSLAVLYSTNQSRAPPVLS